GARGWGGSFGRRGPWKRLVRLETMGVRGLARGATITLTAFLRVPAIKVPHREGESDTVGFLVTAPRHKILWLPDIDKWDKWDRRLEDLLRDDPSLLAFVDGTFFSADEIPGRTLADIPNPLVPETIARFGADPPRGRVFFVHLNHTNRLLWDKSAVKELQKKGFDVAVEGMVIPLD